MVPTGVQMDTSHVDPPGSNYQVLSHSAKNQNQMATSVAVGWFWVGVECVMALTLSIVGREPAVAVGYLALGATTYPDISATRRNLGETLVLTFSLIWLFISLPCFPVLVAAAVSGCKALARLLLRTSGPFRTIVHRRRLAAVADVDNRLGRRGSSGEARRAPTATARPPRLAAGA